MFNLSLNRRCGVPLHVQIVNAVRAAVRDGELSHGMRLPSSRGLATKLRVSRATIVLAYEELAAEGLVQARRGSSTVVCLAPPIARVLAPGAMHWRELMADSGYPSRAVACTGPDGEAMYVFSTMPRRFM